MSQHALLRLLGSLRSADGLELVRSVAERMLQELIETEATSHIGAGWNERAQTRTAFRNGHRDKTLTLRPATWTWQYPSSARAVSSRACWNAAAGSTKPSSP